MWFILCPPFSVRLRTSFSSHCLQVLHFPLFPDRKGFVEHFIETLLLWLHHEYLMSKTLFSIILDVKHVFWIHWVYSWSFLRSALILIHDLSVYGKHLGLITDHLSGFTCTLRRNIPSPLTRLFLCFLKQLFSTLFVINASLYRSGSTRSVCVLVLCISFV